MTNLHRTHLIVTVAMLGAANAVLRPVAVMIADQGAVDAALGGFGVNPAVWVALILAGWGLADSPPRPLARRDVVLAAVALCGLTIPIANASWLVLALYAAVLCLDDRLSPAQHIGATILLVVALREPMVSTTLQLLNEPLLGMDAALTAAALAPFMDGISAEGNIVLDRDGARLVILTSCSSVGNLSYALLFWYAVSRSVLPRLTRPAWLAGAGIAAAVIAQNVLRLALMASSDTSYDVIHGPSGQTLFEVLMLALVLGLTSLGVWHVLTHSAGDRAAAAARTR
jgi:hypothetical protein